MPWPKESLREQLKSWKEVQMTAALEGNKAKPSDKPKWDKAVELAKQMVEKLTDIVGLEKAASKAYQAARYVEKTKPKLKLVSLPVDEPNDEVEPELDLEAAAEAKGETW